MLHRGSKVITRNNCTHMKSARENWGSKVITRNNCACAEGDKYINYLSRLDETVVLLYIILS